MCHFPVTQFFQAPRRSMYYIYYNGKVNMLNILPIYVQYTGSILSILIYVYTIYVRVLPPGQLSLDSRVLRAAFSRLARAALACARMHACCMHCVHACMACVHVSCCCQLLFSYSRDYSYNRYGV